MARTGRPSKYSQDFVQKAREYCDSFDIRDVNVSYKKIGEILPTIEGLALKLGVSTDKVYKYKNEYEEFRNTLEKIEQKQVVMLINFGVAGKFHYGMVKLLLSSHGYVEKTEVESTETTKRIDELINTVSKICKK